MKIDLKENHLAATAGLTACRPALTSPEKSAGFPQCIFPRPLGPSKGRGGTVPSVYFSSPLWHLQGSRRQASRVLFLAPLSPSKGRGGSVLSMYSSSPPPVPPGSWRQVSLSVFFLGPLAPAGTVAAGFPQCMCWPSLPWPLLGAYPDDVSPRIFKVSKFQSFELSKFQSFKVP